MWLINSVAWISTHFWTMVFIVALAVIVIRKWEWMKHLSRKAIAVGALIVVMVVTIWEIDKWVNPVEKTGVRVATSDGNRMIVKHAAGIKGQLNDDQGHVRDDKYGSVNVDRWLDSRKPKAYDIAKAQDARDLVIAIADRRIPRTAIEIPWGRSTWTSIGWVDAPAYIMVGLKNPDGSENMDPRGIYPDAKPRQYKYNKTVTEAEGQAAWVPYQAPLIRSCREGRCTQAQLLTTGMLICSPDQIQAFFNEFVEQAGGPTASAFYYHGFKGRAYHIWFEKQGAAEACANPSQAGSTLKAATQ